MGVRLLAFCFIDESYIDMFVFIMICIASIFTIQHTYRCIHIYVQCTYIYIIHANIYNIHRIPAGTDVHFIKRTQIVYIITQIEIFMSL